MLLHRVALEVAVADEDAEQDARNVGVENRGALAKREAADRAGCIRADALERQQRLFVRRQPTAVAFHGLSRDALEALRPDVVAEGIPRRRHILLGCGGERLERRILLEPLRVLRQHTIDLRLLKHDLRYEDVVRVVGLPPGQVATVAPIPGQQAVAEPPAVGWRGQRQWFTLLRHEDLHAYGRRRRD